MRIRTTQPRPRLLAVGDDVASYHRGDTARGDGLHPPGSTFGVGLGARGVAEALMMLVCAQEPQSAPCTKEILGAPSTPAFFIVSLSAGDAVN